MANIKITDDLKKDLKKYGELFSVGIATQIRDELTARTAYAIEQFYRNYRPIYYNRHYDNFRKKSFRKFYKNPHGQLIRGGVELTPDRMDNIYQHGIDDTFTDVFVLGYHGPFQVYVSKYVENRPPVTDPSPWEMIYMERDYILKNVVKKNSKYRKLGDKKARDNMGIYSTLLSRRRNRYKK